MFKKITAVLAALMCCFALSAAASAALPLPSYSSSVVGSKPITTDTLISAIYQVEHKFMIDNDYDVDMIAAHTLESVAAQYTCTSLIDQHAVTATANKEYDHAVCRDGFMAWYDADGNLCVDSYSRTGSAPAPYYRVSSSGVSGSNDNSLGGGSLSGVISDIKIGTTGFFDIGTMAFNFMLSNPICFLMIGVSLCFVAIKLGRNALRTARSR